MGRVEETHELMNKVEELEKERERERMSLTSVAPKVDLAESWLKKNFSKQF